MHFLTKLFVVIAAVLSLVLSSLVVAYAVNTDRIQADYRRLQADNSAISGKAIDSATQAETQRTKLVAQTEELNKTNANLTARIRELEASNSGLLVDKNRAESARQSIESKIAELGETAKTQAALIESYRSEVTTLRQNELTYRQRALEMETRLSDIESQREVLEQNYRALQEELAELKQTKSPVTALAGVVGEDKSFVYTGPAINGSITELRNDTASGKTLVRLSVGTNDRVAKGMKFIIHRNGQYVGNITITQADMQWSVGEIGLAPMAPQVGDGVRTASN